MRVFVATCVLFAFLAGAMAVRATPVEGQHGGRVKIPGGKTLELKKKFKAAERACVMVIGDHDPVVPLGLEVVDARGNLVGEDKGRGDLCAVIWYPPREEEFTIRISVPHIGGSLDYNLVYIALK